jgi:hypothetical protein
MVEDRAHTTPEKQLLRLIEDPHGNASRGPGVALARGAGVFSLGALQGRIGFFKRSFSSVSEGWRGPLDIKKVNVLLTVLVVGVAVWFVVSAVFLAMRLSRMPDFEAMAVKAGGGNPWSPVTQLKLLAYYKEKVQMRDLFRLGVPGRRTSFGERGQGQNPGGVVEVQVGRDLLVG